jgi:hypothetical protein
LRGNLRPTRQMGDRNLAGIGAGALLCEEGAGLIILSF